MNNDSVWNDNGAALTFSITRLRSDRLVCGAVHAGRCRRRRFFGPLSNPTFRVMDLRQSLDSPEDSKAALNAAAAEFSEGHPTRCKIVVEGDTQKLRTRVKDEVYRIGREAMLNGFTHAQATLVEVRTVYANDALRVRVHDDGKGIDATTLAFQTRPGLGSARHARTRSRAARNTRIQQPTRHRHVN
jgi:hypothetical protein